MSVEIIIEEGFGDFRDVKPLPLDADDETALTRRILRAKVVVNKKDNTEPVRICIQHQKRHKNKEPWQDSDSFNLVTLKAGEEVKLDLSCHQTSALYAALKSLYEVAVEGLPNTGDEFRTVNVRNTFVAERELQTVLRNLSQQHGEKLVEALEAIAPGLLETVALKQQHEQRRLALEEFKRELLAGQWKEHDWQQFFQKNEWIFGFGLDYRYLGSLQYQANYGGINFDGRNAPRGDAMLATKASLGFTVLVEIKTPKTELVGTKYRNQAYEPGRELSAAISQILAQCESWATEGSRTSGNQEQLIRQNIFVHQPKGILVIGNLDQLSDDMDKRSSFELLRRNIHNPEIITFDELLARAEFIVAKPLDAANVTISSSFQEQWPDDSDNPFAE